MYPQKKWSIAVISNSSSRSNPLSISRIWAKQLNSQSLYSKTLPWAATMIVRVNQMTKTWSMLMTMRCRGLRTWQMKKRQTLSLKLRKVSMISKHSKKMNSQRVKSTVKEKFCSSRPREMIHLPISMTITTRCMPLTAYLSLHST